MLPLQRDAFELPDDVAYFNCAYMAPTLRRARQAALDALDRTRQPWTIGVEDFFAPPERVRGLFAQIVGASPDDIAIVPSASFGISVAARNLRLGPGRHVLVLEDEFPSNVYAWRALAQRDGGGLRTVARPSDGDWTSAVLEALDDSVAIAALPHCHWTDGTQLDLTRVGAALARVGARFVVDATQSVGALPIDVRALRIDFLATAAYKWLLGPYSFGFLYAAPWQQAGEPIDYNWITRAGADDFARLVDARDDFAAGARRYDMGERASFQLLPMAIAALEQLVEWQPDRVQQTLAAVTDRIADGASALGLAVPRRQVRSGHLLGLTVDGDRARSLAELLRQRKIYASVRGKTLRLGPHLWTRPRDVERLLEALAEACR